MEKMKTLNIVQKTIKLSAVCVKRYLDLIAIED